MKRIIPIFLLLGLFLPVLFEGCKKPENDPVGPGSTTSKSDTPGYFHLKLQTIDANQNVGLLIVDIKYQQLSKKYDVRGRYVQFNLRDFSTIRSLLQQLRSAVAQADERVTAYATLTNLALKHLEKLPGYVRSIELKPDVLRDIMGGKSVQFGYNGFQRAQPDEWYAWVGKLLRDFVATPVQAQTVSQVVGAKIREWEEMYGSAPSQEQIDRFEANAKFDGYPEEDWRTRMPMPPPPSGGGGSSSTNSGYPASLPTPSGVCPSVSTSALTDFLNGMNTLVSDIAGLLGNLGTSTADSIQQTVDTIKAEFDRLVAEFSSNKNGGRVAAGGCSSRSASGTQGDPMIVGLDGAKQLLHPAGEFWAIHSKNDEFAVQVRFEPVVNAATANQTGASTTTSIAVRTGKDVVSITVKPLTVHINGQEIKADFTGTQLLQERAYMTRPGANQYMIATTWGDLIEVRSNPTFNLSWYVRTLSSKRKNQVEGLLGQFNDNPDDDFQDKSGQIFRPPLTTTNRADWYTKFCGDWRIKQAESMLVYAAGKNTDTYTIADYPVKLKHVSMFDFDLAARNKAEQTCRRAGIIHESDLSDCMLDVLITGRDEMADQMALGIKLKEESAAYFQRLADFPGKAAEGAVGLTVGDKIYAGLGKTSVDWAMYDPATDTWTAKTPFPSAKTNFGYCGTFAIGTKIYFVGGGIDNTRTDQLWEYDVSADKWTQRKSIPGGARYNIAAFATGGKGYALFGTTGWGLGETDYPTKSTFYEYEPTTDSWTQKADFPAKPRGNNITNVEFNGIATVINGRPFVGGGSGSGTVWSDWYEYIPSRNVWEKRANSFGAKYYCSIGNTFYSINDRYVQSYDATTDTWTKYPGKEIYSPIGPNTARGLYQVPVVNGKAYLGLGSSKEWWSFTP